MTKHTPGPWTLQNMEGEELVAVVPKGCGWQRIIGADCISPGIVFGGIREAGGNARLIAAAPSLAAALQECHKLLIDMLDRDEMTEDDAALEAQVRYALIAAGLDA